MLALLRIRQLAIVEEIEVELGPGLTVVTGETGAGKSILVSALELVLGGRASPSMVRAGAARAEIEALFDTPDGARVLRRSVLANGRSRAYVDGALSTVAELARTAMGLVDVCSQHEHHVLVDPATHLGFLDAFAGHGPMAARMAAAHGAWSAARDRLEQARARVQSRTEREDLLRFQVGELEELALAPGELEELETRREQLVHAAALVQAAGEAAHRLSADEHGACDVLAAVVSALDRVARHDEALASLADALRSAREEVDEAANALARYAERADLDPAQLSATEDRWFAARRLVRKYGGSEAELLAHADRAAQELTELAQLDDTVDALEADLATAERAAAEEARALSASRRAAAADLAAAVTSELADLGMGGARVQIDVAPLEGRAGELAVDGARLVATGCDRAELLIAPNPGEPPRPLRRVASGGELSRALLAIKRVLAARGPVGLYVFDEVDAGVGGAVADTIGRKLTSVARHHQVLCITHLPQIAAYGDAHIRVVKEQRGARTVSSVELLNADGRADELARMLGGVVVSDAARTAARDLLSTARNAPGARI